MLSSDMGDIINEIKTYAENHIHKNLLTLHYVFIKKDGNLKVEIIRKKSMTSEQYEDKLKKGWYNYRGNNRPLLYCTEEDSSDDSLLRRSDSYDGYDDLSFSTDNVSFIVQDVITGFIDTCCEETVGLKISTSVLYNRYKIWCQTYNNQTLFIQYFETALQKKGYNIIIVDGHTYWENLSFKN